MDFTFIQRVNGEPYEGRVLEFPDAETAIAAAPTILQAAIDYRLPGSEAVVRAAIGVGQGPLDGAGEVTWLGEWTWPSEEDEWVWTATPGDGA